MLTFRPRVCMGMAILLFAYSISSSQWYRSLLFFRKLHNMQTNGIVLREEVCVKVNLVIQTVYWCVLDDDGNIYWSDMFKIVSISIEREWMSKQNKVSAIIEMHDGMISGRNGWRGNVGKCGEDRKTWCLRAVQRPICGSSVSTLNDVHIWGVYFPARHAGQATLWLNIRASNIHYH